MTVSSSKIEDRHSVTVAHVTVALLSVSGSVLYGAVSGSENAQLPSDLSAQGQSLDHVAQSQLRALVGDDHGYMEQLYTFSFDEPARTEIVVSYLALSPGTTQLAAGWIWLPVTELHSRISHPDQVVLDYAIIRLQAKIGYTTIAFHLMPESFSLSDLQQTYETILGRPLDPRNFRRRMVSSRLLRAENRLRREGSHRPAALYRFAGNHDPASFLTPGAPVTREPDRTAERGMP